MQPEDHVKTQDLIENHPGKSQLIQPAREERNPAIAETPLFTSLEERRP